MAYADQAALAADAAFRSRVRVALMNTAIACALKPFDSANESDIAYKRRVRLAVDIVLRNPDQYVTASSWSLARDTAIVTAATGVDATAGDTAIQAGVDRLFAFMANVD